MGLATQTERLLEKLKQELGDIVLEALADPAVIEVALNPDGKIWVEQAGKLMTVAGAMSTPNAMSLLGTVASSLKTEIHADKPVVEGELILDGSRIEGLIPPVVSAPVFCIRKRASQLFTLDQYEEQGVITAAGTALLKQAVNEHQNILIAGGTGSGKTTFGNALLQEMASHKLAPRIVIIEDTAELQCAADNAVMMQTSRAVNMQGLLRATLRLRPDRIVVGEVRGAEALALLKAWNTGHPGGLATLHANSALAALHRLEQLVAEAGCTQLVQPLIAEAVDLIIAITRHSDGRKVTHIQRLLGWRNEQYDTQLVYGSCL